LPTVDGRDTSTQQRVRFTGALTFSDPVLNEAIAGKNFEEFITDLALLVAWQDGEIFSSDVAALLGVYPRYQDGIAWLKAFGVYNQFAPAVDDAEMLARSRERVGQFMTEYSKRRQTAPDIS
jgi:hypothetical protein